MKENFDAIGDAYSIRDTSPLLSEVSQIMEFMTVDPAWSYMAKQYNKEAKLQESLSINERIPQRAYLTLLNAALTHRRVIFVITRNKLIELLKKDLNYAQDPGTSFSNKETSYKRVLKTIFGGKLFKLVKKSQGRTPMIVEIVHPAILALFSVDPVLQLKEAKKFIKNRKNPENSNIDDLIIPEIPNRVPLIKKEIEQNEENEQTNILNNEETMFKMRQIIHNYCSESGEASLNYKNYKEVCQLIKSSYGGDLSLFGEDKIANFVLEYYFKGRETEKNLAFKNKLKPLITKQFASN